MNDIETKLKRLQPAASGLNRDEILFQAGRATARPSRFWKGLALVLAISQVVTLAVWFARSSRQTPVEPVPTPAAVVPIEPVVDSVPASPLDPNSYWVLMHTTDLERRITPADDTQAPPRSPLNAGSRQFD
jgi:hypothetical protein